ncbi:MAG: hypothetical protein FJY07_07190, partial [Bacteroidetes bacterium]|nr:hypothetical protein [Bacteroidota bacterium]
FCEIIISTLPKPDLIIFLFTSIDQLKRNITSRGRLYEKNIEASYLEKIQSGYFDYFRTHIKSTVLIVDTHDMDFVKEKNDYLKITSLFERDFSKGIHRITFD